MSHPLDTLYDFTARMERLYHEAVDERRLLEDIAQDEGVSRQTITYQLDRWAPGWREHIVATRRCVQCGEPIPRTVSITALYCSRRCRHKQWGQGLATKTALD